MKVLGIILASFLMAGCAGTPIGDAARDLRDDPSAANLSKLGAANTATNIIKTCEATRLFGLEASQTSLILFEQFQKTGYLDEIKCAPRKPPPE